MGLQDRMQKERLSRAGYVVYPGGPLCGNCAHHSGNRCNHPDIMATVDLANGCCDEWEEGDGEARPDGNQQSGQEARLVRTKEDSGDAGQDEDLAQADSKARRGKR